MSRRMKVTSMSSEPSWVNGTLRPAKASKLRVALFGSFYRGLFVLNELLEGPLKDCIDVVGVATDDPAAPYVSAHKRVWQYGYSQDEAVLVPRFALSRGIPVYAGRVKHDHFYSIYESSWSPDICVMATFGQRIDSRLHRYPRLGFYNLHPSDLADWPSKYAGPDPFTEMIRDRCDHCVITLHAVDDGFDTGARVAVSDRIAVPAGVVSTDMHKISAPFAAILVRHFLEGVIVNEAQRIDSPLSG
jgi:methionyl-tRNA formyltransferase